SLELARMYEDKQDYGRATVILNEVVQVLEREKSELRPVELYECLGRVCTRTKQYDQASAAYRKAQELLQEQDLIAVRRLDYELAKVYCAQGKPAEALRELEVYLLTLPPGTEPHEMKVRLLRQLGRDDDVLKSLLEATSRDPHNVALKLLLARQ